MKFVIATLLAAWWLAIVLLAATGVDALAHPDCSFHALDHGCK